MRVSKRSANGGAGSMRRGWTACRRTGAQTRKRPAIGALVGYEKTGLLCCKFQAPSCRKRQIFSSIRRTPMLRDFAYPRLSCIRLMYVSRSNSKAAILRRALPNCREEAWASFRVGESGNYVQRKAVTYSAFVAIVRAEIIRWAGGQHNSNFLLIVLFCWSPQLPGPFYVGQGSLQCEWFQAPADRQAKHGQIWSPLVP